MISLNPSSAFGPLNDNNSSALKHFRKAPLALAIASIAISAQAAEQDATAVDGAAATEIVEVYGRKIERDPASAKFTRPLLDTAQTVNIVPKEIIEERGATTLRDVLRNVSGISMQAGEGGTPAGDQLSIRGYSARTDIFVDNVRDFGGYTRDPFNLEQVEVVKGPSSDYSGRGSTGGSINLVSKAPHLTDFTSSTVAVGSESFSRLTLDVNRALSSVDDSAVRLNLMYHDQDVAGRDEVHNERWGIAPSIAFGLDTDTAVTLSLFHLQQDNVPDYGIPWVPANNLALANYADAAPPVDFNNWYGLTARDTEELSTTMATVNIDHKINDRANISNTTRWGLTERDSLITAPRFASTTSTDIRRSDLKDRDQEDQIISNQTNVLWTINPGVDGEHKILFGVELTAEDEERFDVESTTGIDSPVTDLFNPNPNDPYLENFQRNGDSSTADSSSLAIYASDSIQLNEHWQINGGLRWDYFELEYTPMASTALERTDRMLSYRAGVVYKPAANGSFYLGYGTSFNPTAEALSISTSSRQPGIADLDPEENRTIELGTKWEILEGNFFLSAAIFHTEKTNARTQDPNDPNDLLVLQGEQRVQGIELGLAGTVTDNVSVNLGYTFLDTEITDSKDASQIGNELSNSPKHSLSLWSTYQVMEQLQLGVGAQFVDDRFNNTSNARTAPHYSIYEFFANYELNDRTNLRLNVQNLTDEQYIDYVGGGHFIPGLGRMALLSANFSF